MKRFILISFTFLLCSFSTFAQHEHDQEAPDPREEVKNIKKFTRKEKKKRMNDQLEKDRANLRYERKRYRNDRYGGAYDAISKLGVKQHKLRMKEDRKRMKRM
jgi:hypothetical protein